LPARAILLGAPPARAPVAVDRACAARGARVARVALAPSSTRPAGELGARRRRDAERGDGGAVRIPAAAPDRGGRLRGRRSLPLARAARAARARRGREGARNRRGHVAPAPCPRLRRDALRT